MRAVESNTISVWKAALTFGKDKTFTGPEIQQYLPRKVLYKNVASSLNYLVKKGVLEKTNSWNGDNYIEYRLINDTILPKALTVSKIEGKKFGRYVPGKGLHNVISILPARRSPNLVAAIDAMADQLTSLLEVAKTHPQATITNFTTEELFTELSRRTTPRA
jgi:hypothetical protein